jgi:photosystem II stability/assembly factor-like uncharacterized protein
MAGARWGRRSIVLAIVGAVALPLFAVALVSLAMIYVVGTLPDGPLAPDLRGVSFVDADHGWVVGDYGSIFATADGGTTWHAQKSPTRAWLFGVSFSDVNHGWAVAGPGSDVRTDNAIVRTTDGGGIWSAQSPGTTAGLNSVAALSRLRAVCVGDGGTILATSDGGGTWAPVASGTKSSLMQLCFIDARRGWAVGERDTILATKDGGHSWRQQRCSRQPHEMLTSVSFVDARYGWAVGLRGDRGVILSTRDGGVTWRTRLLERGIVPGEVVFRSRRDGWMADTDRILSTNDGGVHWATRFLPKESDLAAFAALSVTDGSRIWAVGDTGTVAHSVNTGRSWAYRMVGATGQ